MAEHLIKHFRQGFDKLKAEKALKVSNWTCAMKEMGFWNADNSIRLEWYTTDVWEGTDYPQEFKSHMDKVYKRCHKLAEGLPVQEAEKMLLKKLGKQVWMSIDLASRVSSNSSFLFSRSSSTSACWRAR